MLNPQAHNALGMSDPLTIPVQDMEDVEALDEALSIEHARLSETRQRGWSPSLSAFRAWYQRHEFAILLSLLLLSAIAAGTADRETDRLNSERAAVGYGGKP